MEKGKYPPIPIDRVRFIDARLTLEAFSASYAMRTGEEAWDALVTYSDGRNEYFEIQAKTTADCANELRRRGIL